MLEILFIKSASDVIIFKFSNSEKGPWISQLYAGYARASITHVEFKDKKNTVTVFPALSRPNIKTKYSSFWKTYFHSPLRRVNITSVTNTHQV